jgi:hypothetical protein
MHRLLLGLSLCLFWTGLSFAENGAGLYRNNRFHFSVTLPAGWKSCDRGAHDLILLLDQSAKCNFGAVIDGPSIYFYFGFNTDDEIQTVEDAARWDCLRIVRIDEPKIRGSVAGLSIPGHKSLVCDSVLLNGNVETRVVSLPPTSKLDATSTMDFVVSLKTSPARYQRDLETFKQVLAGIRIDPL